MVQKTVVLLEDDLGGGEAVATVSFGLDGQALEIDLNEENATRLRDTLSEYIAHARKAGVGSKAATSRARAPRAYVHKAPANELNSKAVREWAEQNGHTVSHRGRLPKKIIEAFRAAIG